MEYAAPASFDDVSPDDVKIPWFERQAVLADEANGFESLESYARDGVLFWGITADKPGK